MKTFATLALLGLAASAIKLTESEPEFEISEEAWDLAEDIMWECDADGDELCTEAEQADALESLFDDEEFDMGEEWEEEVLWKLDEILTNADDWHYWDEAETDGFVDTYDLAVEVQWQIDHNDLEGWVEDGMDGEFGNEDWDDWEDWEDDWEDWEDDDYWEAPEEVSETAQELAGLIMSECDADGDGLCTLDEQIVAIEGLEIDWDDEEDAMWGDKLLEVLHFADWNDYWDEAEFDGFVTLEDLELEIQWQLDYSNLQEMLDEEDWSDDEGEDDGAEEAEEEEEEI